MNYIMDLRKKIGHEVIMTVGCGVLIENEEGQLLLQKRSDTGQGQFFLLDNVVNDYI